MADVTAEIARLNQPGCQQSNAFFDATSPCTCCSCPQIRLVIHLETLMTTLQKVLYTARTHTTGGREGAAKSDDGLLDVKLSTPKAMGGAGSATNPEQLFAAGYSACFMGAMKFVAASQKVTVPADASVAAEVDIGPIERGFGIAVRLQVALPGMDRAAAQALIDAAHQVCPYSNATRGNVDVTLTLA
jgi:lipoyl-dependent peroxiredoxin